MSKEKPGKIRKTGQRIDTKDFGSFKITYLVDWIEEWNPITESYFLEQEKKINDMKKSLKEKNDKLKTEYFKVNPKKINKGK